MQQVTVAQLFKSVWPILFSLSLVFVIYTAFSLLVGCTHLGANQKYKYKFTCPDGSYVYMAITQYEAQYEQGKIYDKVIKLCKDKSGR